VTAIVLVSGCSTFNREWRKASANQFSTADLQGRWEGTWHSDKTGHSGKLRCIITKTDDGVLHAHFHAKFFKIMSFSYTVPLKAEQSANQFNFSGEADLGRKAGGVYHYEGHADAVNFFSKYSSTKDHGTFQMTRP
jgi:hypothetical protein